MKQQTTYPTRAKLSSAFDSSLSVSAFGKRARMLLAAAMLIFSGTAKAQTVGGPNAKTEWSMGYNAAIPTSQMSLHATTVHSFSMGGFYRVPASLGKLDLGFDVTLGSYACFSRTQTFGMNGVETPTQVNYNSGVTTTSAVVRYNYLQSENFSAFISMKGGMAGFSSRITIDDPNDPDGCKPMEDNKLISDHTWIVGARTGANIDLRLLFPKMPAQLLMFQPYVGFVQGGEVDYINVRNTTMDDHTGHSSNPNDGSNPLDVRFINVQTGLQHSHEVARVYRDPVQFVECGFNVVVRLF